MSFHHSFRNRDNMFARWGGKEKNRLEIKKKVQTFCSCSSFLTLCFLLFFLYSLNLHRFGFSLAGCPNSHWCYKLIDVLCRKFFASSANNASSDSPFPPFLYLNSPLLPLTVFILEVQWVCIWDAIMCIAFIKLGVGMEFLTEAYFFLLTVQKRWLVWEWFFAFPSQGIQKISLDKNFLLQCGNLPICCRHQFYGNPSFLIFWNWESEREVFHFPVLHAKEAE